MKLSLSLVVFVLMSVCLSVGAVHQTESPVLIFRINESQWKQPPLPLSPPPSQSSLIKAKDSGPVWTNSSDGAGRERETGSRGDEVSINVSQRRLCLDCKLLLADALLFYNQRSLSRKKVEGEEKEKSELRGRNRNSGRAPRGEKRVSEYYNNL